MERMGLVSYVEEDLERVISLGLLPEDGFLPSEQLLARRYRVSRATAREALLRLSARGLVVQHPGRRSRAVALEKAVTLENLSIVLHGEGGRDCSEKEWLINGYFALKREMTVDLLATCCEHASKEELSQLEEVCFALSETAPWEQQSRWVEREFELLRLAARVANRPGHFLLIQSLERSFWRMADRLLPHLSCESIRQWSRCALHALFERDVQALRQKLLALLHASDEHLLSSVAPARESDDTPQTSHASMQPLDEGKSSSEPVKQELPGAVLPNRSTCPTGSSLASPPGSLLPTSEEDEPGAVWAHRSTCPTSSSPASPKGSLLAASEEDGPGAVLADRSACPTGSWQTSPKGSLLAASGEGELGAVLADRSACPTGSWQAAPTGSCPPVADERTQGAALAHRSACPTGSGQVQPTVGAPHDSALTLFGQPWGSMSMAGRGSNHAGVQGLHAWSPVPWALAPSPADARMAPPGSARSGHFSGPPQTLRHGCSGPPLPPRWLSWKNGIRSSIPTGRVEGALAAACGPGCASAGSADPR
jgi:GntR family transcriptional repressor for pyruvate dehydrogenase complex